MFPRKVALVGLAAALALGGAAVGYFCMTRGAGTGSKLEEMFYERLRTDGILKYQGLPWEIVAKRVHGRQLHDVELRRRDSNQKYDLIVRAREGELRVDESRRQLLVQMKNCNFAGAKPACGNGMVSKRVLAIDLTRFLANVGQ